MHGVALDACIQAGWGGDGLGLMARKGCLGLHICFTEKWSGKGSEQVARMSWEALLLAASRKRKGHISHLNNTPNPTHDMSYQPL